MGKKQALAALNKYLETKGGPGSGRRPGAGHVIGKTTSGKEVYDNKKGDDAAYKNFSDQDHKEAADMHNDVANKDQSSAGETRLEHHQIAGTHMQRTNEGVMKVLRAHPGMSYNEAISQKSLNLFINK